MSLKRCVGTYRCINCYYTWEYIMCRSKSRRDCPNCAHSRISPEKEVNQKYSYHCSLIIIFIDGNAILGFYRKSIWNVQLLNSINILCIFRHKIPMDVYSETPKLTCFCWVLRIEMFIFIWKQIQIFSFVMNDK